MSSILYYSNFCEHSKKLLQTISKANISKDIDIETLSQINPVCFENEFETALFAKFSSIDCSKGSYFDTLASLFELKSSLFILG